MQGCLMQSRSTPFLFFCLQKEKRNQEGIHWQFNQIARQWQCNSCHKRRDEERSIRRARLPPSTASMRSFPRLLEKQCFVRGVGPAQALCRIREMKSAADPELVSLGPWLRSAYLWSWCFCSSWRRKVSVWSAARGEQNSKSLRWKFCWNCWLIWGLSLTQSGNARSPIRYTVTVSGLGSYPGPGVPP